MEKDNIYVNQGFGEYHLSCVMRKPAFCICENKGSDQLPSNGAADQHFCFNNIDSTILNLKFQASNSLLWLYSLVCVRPGRSPEDRLSCEATQLISFQGHYQKSLLTC